MTYKEYEIFVKNYFERISQQKILVEHQQDMVSSDGSFNIDLSYKFKEGDFEYLVIIECKHSKNLVKRDIVLNLNQKRISLKAHKAIVVTTTGFQTGAIEYAKKNGIGLMKLTTSGDKEMYSNFSGNYEVYEQELRKKTIIEEKSKLKHGFGIIAPNESLEEYFQRKFGIDIELVLSSLHQPEKLSLKNYLPNVPPKWSEEYVKLETCGLELILENENIIRMIDALLRFYHDSQDNFA